MTPSFLEALDERVLVCDGAMGTMLYARGVFINRSFDALNDWGTYVNKIAAGSKTKLLLGLPFYGRAGSDDWENPGVTGEASYNDIAKAYASTHGGSLPPASADTFSHPRHAKLACLVCHQTGDGHGRPTFEPPRGCAICHHQAPATARCATCHQTDEVATPQPVTLTVTVPGRPPAARPVDFVHDKHASRRCVDCHSTPVTLAPSPAAAQCRDCHSDHHAADRACSSCHAISDPKAQHTSLDAAHQRCDACHTPTSVASLTPTRSFCVTCHVAKATKHYDQKECSTCHFLAEPGAYRAKLTSPPR